jgi:putative membrane protein
VTPEPAPAPALTDAQVAAISDAANAGEIEQAKIAQKRGKDAGVKKFAAMMIAHHTEAMQKQAKLLSKLNVRPEETPESMALAAEGTEVLESLKTADAASFDAAYIASQVDAHQKVLIKFDTRLIPSAKNADLRALLEEFRPRVEAHLKEAKEIQRALPVKAVGMNR